MVFITSKNGIYACKNVVETCRKHGDMILRYLLIKMRTEIVKCPSSACGNCQVESQARACYCYSMYLQVVKVPLFNYSISQVSYVHSSRTTDESLHFRLLQKTKTLSRANADFDFQRQSLKDISYDQNFFAKICRRNFEISELKK